MKTDLEKNARKHAVPIIRNESHKILTDYVIKSKPKQILEIGTAIGFSGITMLENSNAFLTTIEHNEEYIKQAKVNFKNSNFSSRVNLINGDCQVVIANMVASKKYDEYFDFIFLDGPKAQYENMLENLIILLKPNGIFLADNVLFHGYIENKNDYPKRYKTIINRLNSFIEKCKNHQKFCEFKLISIEDGMIFAKKVSNEK